jgi:hypothetical protein
VLFNFPAKVQFLPPVFGLTPLVVASDQEHRLAAINAALKADITQTPLDRHQGANLRAALSAELFYTPVGFHRFLIFSRRLLQGRSKSLLNSPPAKNDKLITKRLTKG